jgi:hypothetical protein
MLRRLVCRVIRNAISSPSPDGTPAYAYVAHITSHTVSSVFCGLKATEQFKLANIALRIWSLYGTALGYLPSEQA